MTTDDRAQIAATLWLRVLHLVPKRHRTELAQIVAALDSMYTDAIQAAGADAPGLGLADQLEQDRDASPGAGTTLPPVRRVQ